MAIGAGQMTDLCPIVRPRLGVSKGAYLDKRTHVIAEVIRGARSDITAYLSTCSQTLF